MTSVANRWVALRGPSLKNLLRGVQPYLLLLPAMGFVFSITIYPIAYLFYIAFHSTHYFEIGDWNGIANFAPLFSASGAKSFLASATFVIASDILTLALALLLAVIMEAPVRA